jgi:predicted TIM-barrel fold metal-dependent hydrolase
MGEIDALELSSEVRAKFLRNNAARVYKLDLPR